MELQEKSTIVRTDDAVTEVMTRFFRPSRKLPQSELPQEAVRRTWFTTLGRMAGWTLGAGPSVLLAHGWEGNSLQFVPLAQQVAAQGMKAVAVDLPAHGESEGESATMLAFARVISEVAEQLGSLHGLVAHSMGGGAAAFAMAQGLQVPRALLISPVADPGYYVEGFTRMAGLDAALQPAFYEAIRWRVGLPVGGIDVSKMLDRVQSEILVLHDPADREVPFAHGRAISEGAPRARLIPMEGAGHRRILADARTLAAATELLNVPSGASRSNQELIHG